MGQRQTGRPSTTTQVVPGAQQIAGPPLVAWQTFPLQQTPSDVGWLPSGQTHVPFTATRPSGQQNVCTVPLGSVTLPTRDLGQQTAGAVGLELIQTLPSGQQIGVPSG